MGFSKEMEIAKIAVLEAGKRILDIYETEELTAYKKVDESPLTKAEKGEIEQFTGISAPYEEP